MIAHTSRFTCSILLSLLLAQLVCSQPRPVINEEFIAQMNERIPAWLDEFIVPGAAIALIQDGKVILQKGYGYADAEKQTIVDERTGFNIASISKTVTAWGVMKLVEEGKLELDSPAEKYLTRWHLPQSEFDVQGVTIRRLLSHTAGLSLHGYPGWSPKDTLPSIEESLSGKTNGAGDVKLVMEPGTRYQYSGGGYTLLQLIVEEVTGTSFAEYMQKTVLDPLGMTNSSFDIDERIMKASSLEHDSYGEEIPFELFTAQAAAGLHTTIEDLTKFALASLQVSGSNPVLKESTIDQMIVAASGSDGQYGLGYSQRGAPGSEEKFFGHGGANDGWRSTLKLHGGRNNGFIMITNGATGGAVFDQAFAEWLEWNWDIDMSDHRRKPILQLLVKTHKAKGIEAAIAAYKEVKGSQSDQYYFNEGDINLFGYQLMWAENLDDAIQIFKLNIEEHPYSANPYDSYGEALLAKGDTVASIKNYQRSMELNPQNDYGRSALEALGVYVEPYVEPVSILSAPEDWGSEIIPFPIQFAPTIDLKGFEELSFAPGWRDSTSRNMWAIMFVWYVDRSEDLSAAQLTKYVEAYYDGLMDVEYSREQGAEDTRCRFTESDDGLSGELHVFDNFVKKKMMTLNMKVRQGHCAETEKHLIQFQISPKDLQHQAWKMFDAVELKVKCE